MTANVTRRALVHRLAGLGAATLVATCGGQLGNSSRTLRLRRIGFLTGNPSTPGLPNVALFRQTMRDLGYVEGRDFVVDVRIAEGANELLAAMARELIALPVDVIVAEAGPAQRAAKEATRTVPIVFTLQPDPVGSGMVASVARPGGNITGVSTRSREISPKRVELLKEAVPSLTRVAVIHYAANDTLTLVLPTEEAARSLGVETETYGVRDSVELDRALDTIARARFDGLLALPVGSAVRGDYERIPDFAAKLKLPQIFSNIEIATVGGGLMHLGPDYDEVTRRAAILVDKILKGASPADLPVEQPTKFNFVVNLSMAKRIGVALPDSVLRQATEVVR